MLVDARRRDPRAGEDERERERGKALEDQAAGDRQLRDAAAAFRRLPDRPPEKQTGDWPLGEPPAEQMDGDDRGNGEQGQQPERRRERSCGFHHAVLPPAPAPCREAACPRPGARTVRPPGGRRATGPGAGS